MKIIIVGGGTSGWMTAAYFSKHFNWLDISLIESDTIPRIGVGESVSPHIAFFFDSLGIPRHEWMRETNATYKLTNRFYNWMGEGEHQHFSFSFPTNKEVLLRDCDKPTSISDNLKPSQPITDSLIKMISEGKVDRFDQWHYSQYHYSEHSKAPFDGEDFLLNIPFTHAQHIDAERTADYLRDKVANGVNHIIGDVTNIKASDGFIDWVEVNGNRLQADLFIDCTGMSQLLVKEMNWGKKYYENNLIDSAWVCPIEYEDKKEQFKPYTQSIAQDNGWMFKICLQNRMGSGICYSSNHSSDEEALSVYMSQTSNHMRKPKRIKWEPQRVTTFGEGNCAAVGLSCGFVEPLEGNALFLVYNSIHILKKAIEKYKETYMMDFRELNDKMAYAIDDIADYCLVHYTLMNRDDNEFWKYLGELGKRDNHLDLCREKYRSEKNSMRSALQNWCLFPQYLWAQQALYGKHDISDWVGEIDYQELAELYFDNNEKRHKIISDSRETFYDWNVNYLAI